MPRPRKLDPQEALRLRDVENMTYAEIAEKHGMTTSGVQQIFRRMGKVQTYASHKDVLPWTIAKKHSDQMVAYYLRRLSRLAQGLPLDSESEVVNRELTHHVIKWANSLLDEELDIDYDRDRGPSEFSPQGGFYTKKADPEDWHLSKVMARVRAAMTRNLGHKS